MPKFPNDPVIATSTTTNSPAVQGEGSDNEGVRGISHNGHGGVVGINDWSPATPPGAGGNGGWFESTQGEGVRGWSKNPNHGGVVGVNTAGGVAVYGLSDSNSGVLGESKNGIGVVGESQEAEGVRGLGHKGAGVSGTSEKWIGTYGHSQEADGVFGDSENGRGVVGVAKTATGVEGNSTSGAGVFASSITGIGLYGKGGRLAGFFEGDVEVTGDIRLTNADCAEDFNISELALVEPGTVMVLGEEEVLLPSYQAYDKRVAGVISGAGDYKPGIVLDKQESQQRRLPVALLGKVFCKVDAQFGAIAVGDLLTTSLTPGYAMRVDDPMRAFGAVIGKALRPLKEGQGLIPILIALQ